MWHLTHLSFESYRTFERRESIELRPLTILIGRNGSGKSAIARLPLLLQRGLSEGAEAPLRARFKAHVFAKTCHELINDRAAAPELDLCLAVRDGEETAKLHARIEISRESGEQRIRQYRLSFRDSTLELESRGDEHRNAYAIRFNGEETGAQVFGFNGLCLGDFSEPLRKRLPADVYEWTTDAAMAFEEAMAGLTYDGPVRPLHDAPETKRERPGFLALSIVEHPEAYLHPAAHGALADRYLEDIARERLHFIIETHSENFILRVRRRIAEQRFSPRDVAIYWVNEDLDAWPRVQRINIDAMGGVDTWPSGFFAEDLAEVQAIRQAQHARAEGPPDGATSEARPVRFTDGPAGPG